MTHLAKSAILERSESVAESILASKYGYHLPLYRQSQMFENEGFELSGSLLASWVGKCTKLLERVSDAIRDHVLAGQAIFMDDTTVKLLQKGKGRGKNKIKTARLWGYARDERPWGSTAPPAAWYQFSTSREAQHPSKHLQTYKGFAHADAYAGYNDVYPKRDPIWITAFWSPIITQPNAPSGR